MLGAKLSAGQPLNGVSFGHDDGQVATGPDQASKIATAQMSCPAGGVL